MAISGSSHRTEGCACMMANHLRILPEKEGLHYDNIACILKDSHDHLWFGTWGGGVSKFDGETFTHFTVNEGLSHVPGFFHPGG